VDYDRIVELIERQSSVLDLGCGRGVLLSRLLQTKSVEGLGVEVEQDDICEVIERGLPVVDIDIERDLKCFGTNTYDYVVLSQTLQTLNRPDVVLEEMVRIGHRCIISFPNFVFWKSLLQMFWTGRTPVTESLPFRWYNTPNRHFLSIADFNDFCRKWDITIERMIPLIGSKDKPIRLLPNIRAEEVIFVISKEMEGK
jgi:methionine biosynthesis protein MetW